MKILVTGATGFLGQRTVAILLKAGHQVYAAGRKPETLWQLESLGAQIMSVDLRRDLTRDLAAARDCELIVHTAALSSPWGPYEPFHETNVDGLKNLLRWARSNAISRFIHISTTSLYFDFADRFDIPETALLAAKPASNYTRSKALAERELIESNDFDWIIIRPRGIFGPGDTSILPRVLRVARKGYFPLVSKGKALVDLTYVDNVAHAILLAAQSTPDAWRQIYNISNGEPISVREFFYRLMHGFNLHPKAVSISLPLACLVGSILEKICSLPGVNREPPLTRYTAGLLGTSQTLDISKARERLGYQPIVTLSEGIQRTIDAFE